jgi:hypothetical protein
MKSIFEELRPIVSNLLVIGERAKSYSARKISSSLGYGLNHFEVLFHGENPFKTKFEIIDKYSDTDYYSYLDFESGEELNHAFQSSFQLRIFDVTLDSETGILFTADRKIIAESSSWSPEYLAATSQTRPPSLILDSKIKEERPLINLSSNGFYHWLNEDLPHYLYLREKLKDPITIVSKKRPSYVSDFLLSNSIEYIEVPRFIRCDALNFITKKSNVGWPQPKDVSILREHFGSLLNATIHGKKVYISRIGESRSPSFEKDLIDLLEKKGWIILDASGMSLRDQVSEISSTQVLAGIHGAGLSGVNWLSSGETQLIEIGTDRFVRCFQRLAKINNVKYRRINYKDETSGLDKIRDELTKLNLL